MYPWWLRTHGYVETTRMVVQRRRRRNGRPNAPNGPRVALRSTLGYLIMPRWGRAIDSLLNGFRCCVGSPMHGFPTARSPNDTNVQRHEAPTGRKVIAQGKAKRRPGVRQEIMIASPERAEFNHAGVDASCTHVGLATTDMA